MLQRRQNATISSIGKETRRFGRLAIIVGLRVILSVLSLPRQRLALPSLSTNTEVVWVFVWLPGSHGSHNLRPNVNPSQGLTRAILPRVELERRAGYPGNVTGKPELGRKDPLEERMSPIITDQTAVLVIDVQTGLFCANPMPFEAEAVVARINAVTAKARNARAPIIFIQHDGEPNGDYLAPFTEGWKLHPNLVVQPGELVIRKTTCDAFYGTSLESELRARGATTLLLMGYATDFCVDTTLRNAASKDFGVIVVADAHTTADNPGLKADQVRQHHNWAWANCISNKGVTVLKASEVRFPASLTA